MVKECAGRVRGLGNLDEGCPYTPVWFDVTVRDEGGRRGLAVVSGDRFCYFHAHVAAGLIESAVWKPGAAARSEEPEDLLLHLLQSIE